MTEPRLIKKYPNRRLYDAGESRYITLADIRRLVSNRTEFVIIDKLTNQDITDRVLLQVLCEQEAVGERILSREFLLQTIRIYGTSIQSAIGDYLQQTLSAFTPQAPERVLATARYMAQGGR